MSSMKISIGALGGPATFAGEATRRMQELYPEFSEPVYFPSLEECWGAFERGTIDAVMLSIQRTGQPHRGEAVIAQACHVIAELSQPLECSLYVKPGAAKSRIRSIVGHGSIHQCSAYLDREFPGIPRQAHGLNSVEAAKAVLAGDGTMAVVASKSLPGIVSGLEEMASGIDGGAICSWWAVSNRPLVSDDPDVLVIALRCGPGGELGELVAAVMGEGYRLRAVASFPANSGAGICYDYLITFDGKGRRARVEKQLARFKGARLVGAFDRRGLDPGRAPVSP